MDRQAIIGMVEDYWRAVIPAMQGGDQQTVLEIAQRFEARVDATAKLLPPVEAAAFQQAVDTARERVVAEYQANPTALKRRLGIALGVDAPARRQRETDDLGRLAVRTAVRATVWESVWALFRLGR